MTDYVGLDTTNALARIGVVRTRVGGYTLGHTRAATNIVRHDPAGTRQLPPEAMLHEWGMGLWWPSTYIDSSLGGTSTMPTPVQYQVVILLPEPMFGFMSVGIGVAVYRCWTTLVYS